MPFVEAVDCLNIRKILFFFSFGAEKPASQRQTQVSHEAVQESIMAVDETINNLIKELKQERKTHHKVCNNFKEDSSYDQLLWFC